MFGFVLHLTPTGVGLQGWSSPRLVVLGLVMVVGHVWFWILLVESPRVEGSEGVDPICLPPVSDLDASYGSRVFADVLQDTYGRVCVPIVSV